MTTTHDRQLVRYQSSTEASVQSGLLYGDRLFPIDQLFPECRDKSWQALLAWLHSESRSRLSDEVPKQGGLRLSDVTLAIPAEEHAKILCVGLNYAAHAAEGNREIPEWPVFFIRYPSSFVPHGQALQHPFLSDKYDYEGELAVVVGAPLWRADIQQAEAAILGYTLGMDGSVRDYQKRTSQWTLGKNFDASGDLGPGITMAQDVPSAARGLTLTTHLNSEELQHATTDDMIFPIPQLLSELSQVMRLKPGDMILTGTPEGVGFARTPRLWLQPGDELTIAAHPLKPLTIYVES